MLSQDRPSRPSRKRIQSAINTQFALGILISGPSIDRRLRFGEDSIVDDLLAAIEAETSKEGWTFLVLDPMEGDIPCNPKEEDAIREVIQPGLQGLLVRQGETLLVDVVAE